MSLLTARNNLDCWTNPYVQDGLVAMWDGEWNGGWRVHKPQTETWVDLISGMQLSRGQALQFGENYLVHDSGRLVVENSKIKDLASKAFTFQIVFKRFSIPLINAGDGLVFMPADESEQVWYRQILRIYSTTSGVMPSWAVCRGSYNGLDTTGLAPMKILTNHVYSQTYICKIGKFIAYQGPDLKMDITNSGYEMINSNGQFMTGETGTDGVDYAIRLYDRELSSAEIIDNYEVDKKRFGI